MSQPGRDVGLTRTIGFVGLTAGVVNTTIGAGIFALPAALAASVGSYGPLAFIPCAFAIGAVAFCFSEGGRQIATSGGLYGYVAAAFGRFFGFLSGMLLLAANLLACAGIAAAIGDTVGTLLPDQVRSTARWAVILVSLLFFTAANYRGVRMGTRFVNLATAMKLIPLLIFVLAGVLYMHFGNLALGPLPSPRRLGRAMILGVFSLTGMEVALCASGEVSEPDKTIPRALIAAMAFVSLLYFVIQGLAQGILGPQLSTSAAPLIDAMSHIHPMLRALMVVGAGVSMLGYMASDLLGTPRLLFAFARDRLLPAALGQVHTENRVPHVAIMVYGTTVAILALTGTFAELAILAALASAALYVAACTAVWVLVQRSPKLERGRGARSRGSVVCAACIGIVSMLAVIAAASRVEIWGLVVLIASSALLYALRTPASISLRRRLGRLKY